MHYFCYGIQFMPCSVIHMYIMNVALVDMFFTYLPCLFCIMVNLNMIFILTIVIGNVYGTSNKTSFFSNIHPFRWILQCFNGTKKRSFWQMEHTCNNFDDVISRCVFVWLDTVTAEVLCVSTQSYSIANQI